MDATYFSQPPPIPWRQQLNSGDTSSTVAIKADDQTLYVSGKASDRDRFVTHSKKPLSVTPLDKRSTLTVYHATNHSYIRLHRPATSESKDGQPKSTESRDLVYGKYASNTDVIKCSSNWQVTAYSMPFLPRVTLGSIILGCCWLASALGTICSRKARINDEVRLYMQAGEDYREHPNVTFELSETKADEIQAWIEALKKNPAATDPPLRFQVLNNNCAGFPREALKRAGYPGDFIDYFEEEAVRTRSFGVIGNIYNAHGYGQALWRLCKHIGFSVGSRLNFCQSIGYLPPVTVLDVKGQLTKAYDATTKSQTALTRFRDTRRKGVSCFEPVWVYLSSGHHFANIERLQRAGRYHEAFDEINRIRTDLETKTNNMYYAPKSTAQSRYQDRSELLFCEAIAEKIIHKIQGQLNKKPKAA